MTAQILPPKQPPRADQILGWCPEHTIGKTGTQAEVDAWIGAHNHAHHQTETVTGQ